MSDELTVANRNESWLKGIADGDTDSLEPMTHKELWYKAIADGEVPDFLHPVTHEEMWLQKIAESGGGGESLPRKDVNFVDYDGTVVASYTAAEFDTLTELPKNPKHDDLTAQGWNMTLAEAKARVAAYGKCDIGQMYVSADGKTRLYIHIEDIARNVLPLYWSQTVDNGVEIDFGDGSEPYTASGTGTVSTTHTYAAVGDYVITLDVKDGNLSFTKNIFGSGNADRVYSNCLKKAVLGSVTSIGNNAFNYCYSLASITIPSGVTSIGTSAFSYCYGVAEYHVKTTTPPTAGTTIFKNIPSDCKIYVPSASVDTYKAASGWSTYASQIYGE